MLDRMLPASVAVVETRTERDTPLYPEEEESIRRAVGKRRREFVTTRACAREALERLGESRQAIPSGPRGEPLWPAGTVGSITHCEGYGACAVARRADFLAIGIDAEPDRPLPERVLGAVASDDERAHLRRLAAAEPSVCWDRLLFSAKESVFKAWFPLAGRRLGFADARIHLEIDAGAFSARLFADEPAPESGLPTAFHGHWLSADGLLLTAIAQVNSQGGERQTFPE